LVSRTTSTVHGSVSSVRIVVIRMVVAVAGQDRQQSVVFAFRHRFDHIPKKRRNNWLVGLLLLFIVVLVVFVLLLFVWLWQ